MWIAGAKVAAAPRERVELTETGTKVPVKVVLRIEGRITPPVAVDGVVKLTAASLDPVWEAAGLPKLRPQKEQPEGSSDSGSDEQPDE